MEGGRKECMQVIILFETDSSTYTTTEEGSVTSVSNNTLFANQSLTADSFSN